MLESCELVGEKTCASHQCVLSCTVQDISTTNLTSPIYSKLWFHIIDSLIWD